MSYPLPTRRQTAYVALAVALLAFAAFAGAAQAASWSFLGGDAGRSGSQAGNGPDLPLGLRYRKLGLSGTELRAPAVVSGGPAAERRLVYGTQERPVLQGQEYNFRQIHVQRFDTGAAVGAELGSDIDDGPSADSDTFTGLGENGSVGFVDTSTDDSLGQLFAIHNDDNQQGDNDVALAQIDLTTGGKVRDTAIPGTNGATVSSALGAASFAIAPGGSATVDVRLNRRGRRLVRRALVVRARVTATALDGRQASTGVTIKATRRGRKVRR